MMQATVSARGCSPAMQTSVSVSKKTSLTIGVLPRRSTRISASPSVGAWARSSNDFRNGTNVEIDGAPGKVLGSSLKNVLQQTRRVCMSSTTRPLEKRLSVVCAAGAKERTVPELNEGIANFYNESSGVWEEIWGEHMHHGYYDGSSNDGDHKQAQIRMIQESLAWAGVPEDDEKKPRTVVDVGCGIGGSARYLARKYKANVKAITLSPIQVQRGTAITAEQGLSKSVSFQVADALKQPFADGEFDLVWSMESGEHMPDKRKFVQELARVCAPDGRILIVTWCHRDLKPAELSLTPEESELLDKICDAYYLPAWCSPSDYVRIAESVGLKDVRSADWSNYVTPFWPAVMVSALSLKGLFGLAKAGWTTIKGAFAMGLMVQGYQRGLVKFALITARKAS